jgi:16S rRNA U1498 N3-methylase RsmE
MPEQQWDDILAKALEQSKRSHLREEKRSTEDDEVPEDSDDNELFDPRYDVVH